MKKSSMWVKMLGQEQRIVGNKCKVLFQKHKRISDICTLKTTATVVQ